MFRFPRVNRRALLLGALLALGGAGAQGAAQPAAPPAPECAAPPQLLEVLVGRESRGDFVTRDVPGGWLVEAAALRPSERNYVQRDLRCPDGDFVQLRADLSVQHDEAEQQLVIAPAPALLASGEVDAGGQPPATPVETRPLTSLNGSADIRGDWQTGNFSGRGVLGGGYARGPWAAQAAVDLRQEGNGLETRARFGVSRRVNDAWTVRAGWNSALPDAGAAPVSTDFKGVQVEGRSRRPLELPPVELDLPITSRVTVFLNDTVLAQFTANPGRVTIRRLPRLAAFGILTIFIDDASGRRIVNVPFGEAPGQNRPGEFQARARAGVEGGRFTVSGLGTVAVTRNWVLNASGEWRAGEGLTLRTNGTTALAGGAFGVGLTVINWPGVPLDSTLDLSYARGFGALRVGGGVSVPLLTPLEPRLNLSTSYLSPVWTLGTNVAYDVGSGSLSGGVSAGVAVTSRVNLGGSATYDAGRWRLGVNLGWKPTPALDLGASAGLDTANGTSASATARYALAPGQVAWAWVGPTGLVLGYGRDAPLRTDLTFSTGGPVTAGLSGSLLFAGGRTLVVPEAASRGVLVRTGVPGVPLRTGSGTVRTDAAGNAVAFARADEDTVTVSVDLDALPFNVTVGEDTATLQLAGNGLAVLDWTRNFTVSRWLRLFWAPGQPAGGAVLVVDGRSYRADRDGWVLLEEEPRQPRGELRDPNGSRTCAVTVPARGEEATCAPGGRP